MSYTNTEITININAKRLIALSIIGIITLVSVGSYIIALLAFDSPTYELRWNANVTSAVYYFGGGPPFDPGDKITIKGGVIEGNVWGPYSYTFTDTIDVRWIIIIRDSANVPLSMTSGILTSVSGDFYVPDVNVVLPSDTTSGNAVARLLIWTDWLPGGDTRTVKVTELTFGVN